MRLTGLATGLDMDKIVGDSMKPYRMKIDKTQQKKEIIEIKQQLYRDVIKDSRDLYNKYFDVSKPDSLLLSSNYGVTKFTSSNENVLSVKGGADAKAESYTIKGTTAKAAKAIVTSNIESGKEIIISGKKFVLKGSNEKEIATNLNEDLKREKVNVSVRYSDFAGTASGNQKGLVFESSASGKDNTFTIGGEFKPSAIGKVDGKNATAATTTGLNVSDIPAGSNSIISIGTNKIDIGDITGKTNKEVEKIVQDKIKEHNKTAAADKKIEATVKIDETTGDITFSSTVLGSKITNMDIEIDGKKGTFNAGRDATKATNTIDVSSITNKKISVNGNVIDMANAAPGKEVEYLNKILGAKGIETSLDTNGKIVLTTKESGEGNKIELAIFDDTNSTAVSKGEDTEITFEDSKGGVYKHTGNSNTITLDGVTFKFSGEIPSGGITVNGKTDTTDTKEKLVKFVEDYNVLMEKLNKMTMEKPNKKYQPLTEEQKKELSETEVKLWNEKVKQGQLVRDSDVTRLSNSMKSIMSSMSGTLEKFGITPVADYQGTKHGTLKIDSSKLDAALENNAEDVMNLFIGIKKDANGKETKGVLHQLKDVLYNETVTVTSSLIKKAGIDNSATSSNNELTKTIEKYNKKMADLEKDFARREQALYSKYARLEVSMNKYNSQQSMMAQQFGGQ